MSLHNFANTDFSVRYVLSNSEFLWRWLCKMEAWLILTPLQSLNSATFREADYWYTLSYSCLTNLLTFSKAFDTDHDKECHINYLDFSKTVERVQHRKAVKKKRLQLMFYEKRFCHISRYGQSTGREVSA